MPTDRKTALITGSGRRLGRRLALAYAERNYDIVLHANTSVEGMRATADAIRAIGTKVYEVQADLSDAEAVFEMAKTVQEMAPQLDVLVNNAGVFPEQGFQDVDVNLWDTTMNVNARSVFFLSQQLAPMLRQTRGSIVNIASEGAYEMWLQHIPYNISKAAVVHLTRALAKQLAPDVRVNAIAPGIIIIPDEEERKQPSENRIPLKRYGTVEEFTEAVWYLTEHATYLTGHVLPVDGGMLGAV